LANGNDVFQIVSTTHSGAASDIMKINSTLILQGNVTDSSGTFTSSNVIGGWSGNSVTSGVTGATIAGGGATDLSSGLPFPNSVTSDFGTVGGGIGNTAGSGNTAVSGATVAGGAGNTASGFNSTVPGGEGNTAGGDVAFAAGDNANASDSGSFVWCQQNNHTCNSNGFNSFTVSVDGPIFFISSGPTCVLSSGSSSWACSSDRNLKNNIVPIDSRSVLEQVAHMPISQWSMKADLAGHKHIGPMAQDFYAAFGLGDTDKYIAQGDAQGVALASIQGLYQLVQEKDEQIRKLVQEKDEQVRALMQLKAELQALEQRITPR
jgi:trimeric autotransporter adhesin